MWLRSGSYGISGKGVCLLVLVSVFCHGQSCQMPVPDGVDPGLQVAGYAPDTPDDRPIIVDAGQARTAPSGTTVTLYGSLIRNLNGQPLTVNWAQTDGPAATISPRDSLQTKVVTPSLQAETPLTFTLSVTDGVDVGSDTVTITVAGSDDPTSGQHDPLYAETLTANAGLDQIVQGGTTVILEGSANLSPAQFVWRQVSGPVVMLANVETSRATFTAPLVETDTALIFATTAVVADQSATDTVVVVVTPGPVSGDNLVVVPSATQGIAPFTVSFTVRTASGSPLPAGTYIWDYNDGSFAEGINVSHLFGMPGTYVVGVCHGALPGASTQAPCAQVTIVADPPGTGGGGGSGVGGGEGNPVLSPSAATLPAFSNSDASLWTSYLRSLAALQKVHYTGAWPEWLLASPGNELGVQLARITHAVTICGETATEAEVAVAVDFCKRAAGTSPQPTLAIACRPWEHVFPAGAPPTDTGASHALELNYWQNRFQALATWVAAANQASATDIKVSAVLLWADRFTASGNPVWDAAITDKYNVITTTAKSAFAGARIEWRGRGIELQLPDHVWRTSPHYTFNESQVGYSCILDAAPELDRMRDTFRRTVELAGIGGIQTVTPWVSLGAGARRGTATPPVYQDVWDYHLVYSWQLGAELNIPWYGWKAARYAPWGAANVAVLDGIPFSEDSGVWPRHFVSYVLGAAAVTGLPNCSVPATTPSNITQVVQWLQALPPLQKVHYSWPLSQGLLDNPSDPRYAEYIRITHAITLCGEAVTAQQVNSAVVACRQINVGGPAVPARIALSYSPWHRVFPEGLPPTDMGPMHDAEIAQFFSRMDFARNALASANATHGADIQISAILLDTERFFLKEPSEPGAADWNEAMRIKYDAIYDAAKSVFPNARVDWYGRGSVHIAATDDGWANDNWYALTEKGDAFSCPLYRVPALAYMRDTFRRTLARAQSRGVSQVIPWIALGAGYREASEKLHSWVQDWDYDSALAWQLGAEVNNPSYSDAPERFAPWSAAPAVVFYPPPFDTRSPAWERHFVAYCRGAAGIPDLP